MDERFYFEPGFSLRAVGSGDEVRLLDRFRQVFRTRCVARDNWAELSGEAEDVRRAVSALQALQQLFLLRGKELDRADVEMILRGNAPADGDALRRLWSGRVVIGAGHKDILPRSARQKEYLDAIRNREVVFGGKLDPYESLKDTVMDSRYDPVEEAYTEYCEENGINVKAPQKSSPNIRAKRRKDPVSVVNKALRTVQG